MTSPKERLESFLPYLDPQQAASILLWHRKHKVCDVEEALTELLSKYPVDFALEAVKGSMATPQWPLDTSYVSKDASFWSEILKATLALRGEVPDSSYDFRRVPKRILEGLTTLSGRLVAANSAGAGTAARSNAEVMYQLAWLLHWTFWVMMRYYLPHVKSLGVQAEAWSEVVEELFSERVLQTVALVCPHLVRYYVVLVLPDRKRTEHVWLLISLITTIRHKLDDPFARFALHIFHDTNLSEAREELKRMAQTNDDFLLADPALRQSVVYSARLLIFEHYCRIHQELSLATVRQLATDAEEANEKWVVGLVKDAKIDAKIDAAHDALHIATAPINPYAAIIEKAKSTFYKTNQIIKSLNN